MSGKHETEVRAADEAGIARAVDVLRGGGLVALPTETVYGLAARADSDEAVARIYAAKGRPSFNPLIVHLARAQQAADYAQIGPDIAGMAQSVWPGPVTLALPRKPDAKLADAVTAGLNTVALRVPRHDVAHEVLSQLGLPLAAPSANRSGFASPTTAEHVLATLGGRIDLVLDGGSCEQGVESTILKWLGDGRWQRLRPGPQEWDTAPAEDTPANSPRKIEAPGQLESHYSPGKPVRLNAQTARDDEFMIGFGEFTGDCSLSPGGDLAEAARQLYACLHLAAQSSKQSVAVAPVPEQGIGVAINDRLRRAAA